MSLQKRALAEFMGTFWLVFGGCGSAVLAAAFPALGIGFAWRGICVRSYRADDGLCHRPHLRVPFESCRFRRACDSEAVSRIGTCRPTLSHRSWRGILGAGILYRDCQWQSRV